MASLRELRIQRSEPAAVCSHETALRTYLLIYLVDALKHYKTGVSLEGSLMFHRRGDAL